MDLRTILLLSGGIDSSCIAHWMKPALGLTVDYGQRPAEGEIRAARQICTELGIAHEVLRVPVPTLGVGDMSPSGSMSPMAPTPEWWPFRNQLLITLAAARAATLGFDRVVIGTVRGDEAHKDGTPLFIERMREILSLQECSIALEAPALALTTLELIEASETPLELLGWTHSCHVADHACGTCRGCERNLDVFERLRCARGRRTEPRRRERDSAQGDSAKIQASSRP